MNEGTAIRAEAERRGITRLVHFTPTQNLVHIATSDEGLRSTKTMSEDERADFNQQDLARLDHHPDHISCAIQYPNAYYYRKKRKEARGERKIFSDWVCLLIAPKHLWAANTLFCPHNAAGWGGDRVAPGLDAFVSMFADEVEAPQSTWNRQHHPDCCPTDAQAEVLVHRQIPLVDLLGIVVESPERAGSTYAALSQLNVLSDVLPLFVCPEFYEPVGLAAALRSGGRPVEEPWHPPIDADGKAIGER